MDFAFGHVGEHIFQFGFLLTRQFDFAEFTLTIQGNFTCFLLVANNRRFITRCRNTRQAEDFNRNRRTRFANFTTKLITHRTYAAIFKATQNDIAFMQSTFAYQNGSNRTTTFIQEGFDHNTARHTGTDSFQLKNLSLQQDSVEQFVDTGTRFCRYMNELAFAAPLFRHNAVLGQFILNAIRIRFWLIDFVHCNNNRYLRRFCVLDSFDCLRHHAIVSSHNQNHDIRCLRTTCTHRGKRGVARGIQEGDHAVFGFDVVCTNVLGNAARFT